MEPQRNTKYISRYVPIYRQWMHKGCINDVLPFASFTDLSVQAVIHPLRFFVVKILHGNKKVAVNTGAYSLLESIVAMVLIMIVGGASLLVLSGQLRGHQIQLLHESNVLINTIHHYAIAEENFSNETIDMDNLEIIKEVTSYKDFGDLFVFTYTAYTLTQKEILTKKFMVRHEEIPN